jgi:hypothetical protein
LCHPCQACDNYAQGYSAGPPYPWREGLIMILCQACDNYAQGHQARSSYPWRERINHDFVLKIVGEGCEVSLSDISILVGPHQ